MATNPYLSLKAAYLTGLQQAQAGEAAQAKNAYDTAVSNANKQYDKSANDAYINYRQSVQTLPDTLSRQGLTGGASESANIKLQSAYGQNLNNNEMSREQMLAQLQANYNDNIMSMNNNYLKQRTDATADYDRLIAQWEEEERARQAELAAQQAAASRYYSSGGGSSSNDSDLDYTSYLNNLQQTDTGTSGSTGGGYPGLGGSSGKFGNNSKTTIADSLRPLIPDIKRAPIYLQDLSESSRKAISRGARTK